MFDDLIIDKKDKKKEKKIIEQENQEEEDEDIFTNYYTINHKDLEDLLDGMCLPYSV